jgi:hypothetical protein
MIPLTWTCSKCKKAIIADQVEQLIILIDIHNCGKM